MTINLFENHLSTARQNVELIKASLAETLVASARNPNDSGLAATAVQLEHELNTAEASLKRAEIASTYASKEQDAETVAAQKEAAEETVRNAHMLLVREHRAYSDNQIAMYRALAGLAGGDLQIVQARLSAFCSTLAKAATRGVLHAPVRAAEKYRHVHFFLLGDTLPEIHMDKKAVEEIEYAHKRVVEWADRSLAESLAAIGAQPAAKD